MNIGNSHFDAYALTPHENLLLHKRHVLQWPTPYNGGNVVFIVRAA